LDKGRMETAVTQTKFAEEPQVTPLIASLVYGARPTQKKLTIKTNMKNQ